MNDAFILHHTNKYICACGCGEYIIILPYHKYKGIPKFIDRHQSRVQSIPVEKRFWARVNKTESCWLWTGLKTDFGYGHFEFSPITSKKEWLAHRVSWILHKGPIPIGLKVLHNCPGGDNPSCVNPNHLWLGTQKDNMHDCHKKGRTRSSVGEHNTKAKLTEEKVHRIRKLYTKNICSNADLAFFFKVSECTINDIVVGRTWKHLLGRKEDISQANL